MGKKSVKQFLTEIGKDEELGRELLRLTEKSHEKAEKILMEKLVGFGRKNGFKYSEGDLHEAMSEMLDELNENGEVLDEDLQKVAGGINVGRSPARSIGALLGGIVSMIRQGKPDCKGW